MTLDEALRIEANARDGILDEDLPGTRGVIDQAHRVHQTAYMWGSVRGESAPPRIRWGIAMGVAMVLVTLGGFTLTFLAPH
ncbi:hypothetical protein GCM10011399_07550 [Subtercola lobariae]|uniref:Uncharacterized protein n=2 Tax=Subtercola lobariae TaxID=1588641 RepID=A0A917B1A3_9MICO|nr:hypothetical protein [Subtercola lobariae]GGF16215.1 hypothetical protein GCM10011399_07550 [Subtercola lobariae]